MHSDIKQQLLLLLLVLYLGCSRADIFKECNETNDQKFISSDRSCAHYIFCNGAESFEGECESYGEFFNFEEQLCDQMVDINCRTGEAITSTSNSGSTSAVTMSTTAAVGTTVRNTVSTAASSVSISTSSSVAATTISSSSSSSSSSITSMISNNIDTVLAQSCPTIDDPNRIVLLPNSKSCSDYFVCYHGEPLAMHCSPMLHFNALTGKCDHAQSVRCWANAGNAKEQCKQHTEDLFPHAGNCNYYYYCRHGFLLLQQCPFFYGWDYEKRSCVALSQAKCYNKPLKLTI